MVRKDRMDKQGTRRARWEETVVTRRDRRRVLVGRTACAGAVDVFAAAPGWVMDEEILGAFSKVVPVEACRTDPRRKEVLGMTLDFALWLTGDLHSRLDMASRDEREEWV